MDGEGEGHLLWMGEGVPTLNWGGTYLGQEKRGTYLGWGGEGVPTLDWGEGIPILDGGGVPTLDRLFHGRYASCGFPQEDFLVDDIILPLVIS